MRIVRVIGGELLDPVHVVFVNNRRAGTCEESLFSEEMDAVTVPTSVAAVRDGPAHGSWP